MPANSRPEDRSRQAWCLALFGSEWSTNVSKPDFIAYSVIEKGKNVKPYRHCVGSAWKTKKGDGITLHLDSFPSNGSGDIVLMPQKDDERVDGVEA